MENESNFPLGGAIIPLVGPGASCGYLGPRQLKDPGMDPPPQFRVWFLERVDQIELWSFTVLLDLFLTHSHIFVTLSIFWNWMGIPPKIQKNFLPSSGISPCVRTNWEVMMPPTLGTCYIMTFETQVCRYPLTWLQDCWKVIEAKRSYTLPLISTPNGLDYLDLTSSHTRIA